MLKLTATKQAPLGIFRKLHAAKLTVLLSSLFCCEKADHRMHAVCYRGCPNAFTFYSLLHFMLPHSLNLGPRFHSNLRTTT